MSSIYFELIGNSGKVLGYNDIIYLTLEEAEEIFEEISRMGETEWVRLNE